MGVDVKLSHRKEIYYFSTYLRILKGYLTLTRWDSYYTWVSHGYHMGITLVSATVCSMACDDHYHSVYVIGPSSFRFLLLIMNSLKKSVTNSKNQAQVIVSASITTWLYLPFYKPWNQISFKNLFIFFF